MSLPLDEKLRRGAGAAGLLGILLGVVALGGRLYGIDIFRATEASASSWTARASIRCSPAIGRACRVARCAPGITGNSAGRRILAGRTG